MIVEIIKQAVMMGASDVHITEGKKVALRLGGDIIINDKFNTVPRDIIVQFLEIAVPDKLGNFLVANSEEGKNCIDFSFTEDEQNIRVRGQVFRGIAGMSLALRILYGNIPTIQELQLPDSVSRFSQMTSGLVIFTGATGSGKSTTQAAIINEINKTRSLNILTIEDPIEYIHKDNMSRMYQREIGRHVQSFAEATVEALRQDPDVIQVGEMRDLVTIENALTMAETGHLVFGTLHSLSTVDTIDRIINVFPENKQNQIRFSLSNILRGVVSQKLIRTKTSGDRIPLCEIMMIDDTLANFIRKQQDKNSFRDTLRTSKDIGCVHLVDNALSHIQRGRLTLESLQNHLSDNDYKLLQALLPRR